MSTELTFWTVAEAAGEAVPELRPQLEALVLDSFDRDQRPYPHRVLEEYLLPFVEDGTLVSMISMVDYESLLACADHLRWKQVQRLRLAL